MSRMTRWIASIAAGIVALPVGYGASLLISASSPIGTMLAVGNALTLIP